MNRSTLLAVLGGAAAIAALGVARYSLTGPRAATVGTSDEGADAPPSLGEQAREALTVGFLPVTCHLTCPVTDFASRTGRGGRKFDSKRFGDFPTVAEAFRAGKLEASFMIAPLAMKLREQGLPLKIVYLGHRDGSTFMVRHDSKATSIADLRGKRIAIPSRYSNQHLVLRKLMEDKGMEEGSVLFVELPPPEMPAALASGDIEGYFVGEPHAAKAEVTGSGRILHHAKDIWPKFISCVMVVSETLIERNPTAVRDLVRGIAESGEWIDKNREDAAKIGAEYFKQDEALVRHALTQPRDRVKYTDLAPSLPEFERMQAMAVRAGILEKGVAMADLIDTSFIPAEVKPADVRVSR